MFRILRYWMILGNQHSWRCVKKHSSQLVSGEVRYVRLAWHGPKKLCIICGVCVRFAGVTGLHFVCERFLASSSTMEEIIYVGHRYRSLLWHSNLSGVTSILYWCWSVPGARTSWDNCWSLTTRCLQWLERRKVSLGLEYPETWTSVRW